MGQSKAHFGFTKLLVDDLDRSAAFYSDVAGLVELVRVESDIAGRPIREILFNPTGEGGATFALLKFLDADRPGRDEAILGFQTEDLQAFVERATTAGATIVAPIREMPEHGVRVAFVADIEGHLLEVVEVLPGAHQ